MEHVHVTFLSAKDCEIQKSHVHHFATRGQTWPLLLAQRFACLWSLTVFSTSVCHLQNTHQPIQIYISPYTAFVIHGQTY